MIFRAGGGWRFLRTVAMMRAHTKEPPLRRWLLISLSLSLCLSACTVRLGGTCKEDNDCNKGLYCCKMTVSPTARGTCEPSCVAAADAGM